MISTIHDQHHTPHATSDQISESKFYVIRLEVESRVKAPVSYLVNPLPLIGLIRSLCNVIAIIPALPAL